MRSYFIILTLLLIGCMGVNRNVGYPPKRDRSTSPVSSASTTSTVSSSAVTSVDSSTAEERLERNYLDTYLNGEEF